MYSPVAWAVAVRAAPAKKRRLSTTKSISSGTAAIGLPTLRLSRATSSPACSSSRSASRHSAVARSPGGVAAHSAKAAAAAATARSTSAADEDATSAITSPVAGSSTGVDPAVSALPPLAADEVAPGARWSRPVPSRRRLTAYPDGRAARLASAAASAGRQRLRPLIYVARHCPAAEGGRHGRGHVAGGAGRRRPDRGLRRALADRRVQLLQLGPQVLPRGVPGDAGHPRRGPHPDRLPRERGGDGAGGARGRGRRPRLRPLHPVRRLRAALPEHALHRGLLPLPHPDGGPGEGGAGAGRRLRRPPARLAGVEPAHRRPPPRAGGQRHAGRPGAGGRLGGRPRPAGGRRDRALLRLRGRLPPHLAAPRGRPHPAGRRGGVRPHARAVVLRRAGGRDGLRRAGPPLRRAQRRRLAGDRARSGSSPSTPTTTSRSPRTTRASSATTSTSRSCSRWSWSPRWCARGGCR